MLPFVAWPAPMETRSRSSPHRSLPSPRSSPSTRRSWWGRSLRRRLIRSRSCCYRVSSTGCASGATRTPTSPLAARAEKVRPARRRRRVAPPNAGRVLDPKLARPQRAAHRSAVSVPSGRDDDGMTDDEVLDRARADGFELVERMSAGQWAVGWARGTTNGGRTSSRSAKRSPGCVTGPSRGCGVRLSTRSHTTMWTSFVTERPLFFFDPQSMQLDTVWILKSEHPRADVRLLLKGTVAVFGGSDFMTTFVLWVSGREMRFISHAVVK